MKEVYEAIAEIEDYYGIPVLCQIMCHECYNEIINDETFSPESHHFFATLVNEKTDEL